MIMKTKHELFKWGKGKENKRVIKKSERFKAIVKLSGGGSRWECYWYGTLHLWTYGNGYRKWTNLSNCNTQVVLGLDDYLRHVILHRLVTIEYPFLMVLGFSLLHSHLLNLHQTLDRAWIRQTGLPWWSCSWVIVRDGLRLDADDLARTWN